MTAIPPTAAIQAVIVHTIALVARVLALLYSPDSLAKPDYNKITSNYVSTLRISPINFSDHSYS